MAGDTGAAPEHRPGLYSGHAMTAEQAQRLARRYGTRLTAFISS